MLLLTHALSAREALQEITVRDGDTLWGIANTYLKDPKKWPEILKYNQMSLSDPAASLPGMKLKVPVLLIKEELRKAYLIYLLNDVRFRKKNDSVWSKGLKNSELYNDYALRTLEDSQAHVRFYSGEILKLDQNSLVVLRPEQKVEEVNLLAGTLQSGRVKLITPTAQVTPLSKDTLYKARLRIDKGLIVQVERGSTEVMGNLTGGKVIVNADEATIALPNEDPIPPVNVGNMKGMEIVDFDKANRVIVPAGHANLTLPNQAPGVPMKVPSLPDFQVIDFDESGKAVIPSLYAKGERRGEPYKEIAPLKDYKPGRHPADARPGMPGQNGSSQEAKSQQDEDGDSFAAKTDEEIDNSPPKMVILKPREKFFTRKRFAQVEGKTSPRCFVRVNDYQVPVKADAKFSWSVLLKEGENKIHIVVTNKSGMRTEVIRTVVKLKPIAGELNPTEEEN